MLEIKNLTHTYSNGTRALDDVNLRIPAGMFGLLGPNGAGKSSLMRCLATLQVPSSGSIRFGDLDVLAQPEALRATLGYLPQDFGVYPRVSAEDLLDHLAVLKGISSRGERRDTVHALLRQVNLWDIRIRRLSLGNAGDAKPIGDGISELRIDHGPGYRVYFVQRGDVLIVLLAGGDKSTQDKDIRNAKALARDLKEF